MGGDQTTHVPQRPLTHSQKDLKEWTAWDGVGWDGMGAEGSSNSDSAVILLQFLVLNSSQRIEKVLNT